MQFAQNATRPLKYAGVKYTKVDLGPLKILSI